MKKVLVAGGAGYIGSHICVELINEGYEPFVIDNLYNSSELAIRRVEEITGKKVPFYRADFLNADRIRNIVVLIGSFPFLMEEKKSPLKAKSFFLFTAPRYTLLFLIFNSPFIEEFF